MLPDVAVLSRLLDPSSPYNPATAAVAAAAVSAPGNGHHPPTPLAGVVAAAAAAAEAEVSKGKVGLETKGQWKDSLRAINDIILRRHFAALTRYVWLGGGWLVDLLIGWLVVWCLTHGYRL